MSDTDDLDAGLARLVSDSRAEDAARARIRERSLRASAVTEATFSGVVLDVAEGGEQVAVRTTSGRMLAGRVILVARDAVAIASGPSATTFVRLAAIASIRHLPGGPSAEPSGDRPPPRSVSLVALLADLAPHHPRITLVVTGEPAPVTGELRAAGVDVLTVRLDGDPPVTAYFPTAQLSELTVLASG